ncbi:alpha/beta fold hydrolase [Nocardia sp. XZ_19_385]|uniref:alpha/beta fold hydrolase n=1 Tax=Nocardia sp. XZ_19_385 TaxID=2769488 RepID=UPI00188E1888|nr:alpha/beta hydrolase [Nocardia sp. XZ_19_385]
MKPFRRPGIAVALPGTGSDADFARRSFEPACRERDLELMAVEPDPLGVVASYRAALDSAAQRGPVLAAGISLGAAVALEWAAEHPEDVTGVIAALPAWTGADTANCPAAQSAAYTAGQLRAHGLDAVIEQMRGGSPEWLAAALTQSWRAQWPNLPQALQEAADYKWPGPERLRAVGVPVVIITAVDDPVHPLAVAEEWAALIPRSGLARITLDELGADPAILGHTGLAAFD